MKIWTETVNLADSVVSLTDTFPGGNYSLEDSLFFDIETTGFKAEYCFIYMIGCATFAGSEATITLFFADTRSDEKAVLEAFGELLATKQQCFTFNGNHFDIPFIEKRCEKHGLDFRPSTMACFDLYLYAKQFKKVFISYAHEDESQVKVLASTYKKLGVEYFLDRDYLKGGDVFGEVISHYIKEADLFILCWSEHAAKSEYVKKERTLALSLAYPQVIPREKAQLSIYPISMKPKAPYPDDMKEIYNFEEI